MECIFNKEKLKGVLYDFYKSTGIAITLYDASEQVVATSPIYSDCCSLIRESEDCVKRCDRSNLTHMDEVATDRSIICYTCHAGLMETILPIMYEGVLIAYLQIGQFRDAEGIYSTEAELLASAQRYGLDRDELLCRYRRLPTVSRGKLDAICNILDIIIKSFWEDGLIAYKRSMLSVRIEKYVNESLSSDIYIDKLAELFGVSKNALYKIFREEFSSTVNGYITKKRLELAEELLKKRDDINITEIALACGFPDYNYFIRVFKRHYGVTPLGYRRRARSIE